MKVIYYSLLNALYLFSNLSGQHSIFAWTLVSTGPK